MLLTKNKNYKKINEFENIAKEAIDDEKKKFKTWNSLNFSYNLKINT